MKKHTIIGTAGHIDHGKTAIIRALTGIDADRLKEEKERGITIDIGFAYWKDDVTILDVPGHERFIRNMVAGVNTVDFFMLVIAADDGIMPQTIEHLDILNFFNIRDGIIILNKVDLVDEEWLTLVEDEILNMLNRYQLQDLPIIKVSAETNYNIDLLKETIENKIASLSDHDSKQPFRLFVDRSFIIKGFGTVVTGTALSGQLKKGEEIEILPAGTINKVRGLQAHGKDTDRVMTGDRAAINLHGISKNEINRGDAIIQFGTLQNTTEFIGTIKTVSTLPVKIANRSKVRIYVGTAERIGQLIWFGNNKLLEEESTYSVRIKLESPVAGARNDPFLIRLHSPLITLAGGKILEINPPKIHHRTDEWQAYFEIMSSHDLKLIVERIIKNRHQMTIAINDILQKLHDDEAKIELYLNELITSRKIRVIRMKGKDHYIHQDNFNELLRKIEKELSEYHKQNLHLPGLNIQELIGATASSWIEEEVFENALRKLVNSNILKIEQNYYSLFKFSIQVSKDIDKIKQKIPEIIKAGRFSPPILSDISEKLEMPLAEIRSIVNMLLAERVLVRFGQEFFLHRDIWEELISFLKNYFHENSEMPVSALKEFINTTRKYAIPLFEYLDAEGYTLRQGDIRKKGHRLL